MSKREPFMIRRYDYCMNCKSERALEVYDRYNRPLGFSKMIDATNYTKLDQVEIKELKCTKCEARTTIPSYVNEKRLPSFEAEISYQDFINKFKEEPPDGSKSFTRFF